jgi:hypothetical protein
VIWKGEQRKFLNLKEGRIRIKDEIKWAQAPGPERPVTKDIHIIVVPGGEETMHPKK